MATKQPTKKRASKAPAKKRTSKAPAKKRTSKVPRKTTTSARGTPAKKTAKKRASKAPGKKRGSTLAPASATRPTTPARPRAKKAAAPVSAPPREEGAPHPSRGSGVSPVVTESRYAVPPRPESSVPPPRVASYLESVPKDRAELVAGLFQVARGAAKDLRTLFTQALSMSHQKSDRYDR
jgi:hypothetical protein